MVEAQSAPATGGKYCASCGQPITRDGQFCGHCGAPTTAITEALSSGGQVNLEFQGTPMGALKWGLWAILLNSLIVPTGWAVSSLARWYVTNLRFSDGTVAQFNGHGGQIWGYFILAIVASFLLGIIPVIGAIIGLLVTSRIYLHVIGWFFQSIQTRGQHSLGFTGTFWPYVGWTLLLFFSVFTIIGWAWVLSAILRWFCKNITMGDDQVVFVGTGWQFLWRTLAVVLGSVIILPIPWLVVWHIRWVTRNIVINPAWT